MYRDTEAATASAGESVAKRAAHPPRRFISNIVRDQIKTRAVFRCGQQHVMVWGKCAANERKELATRLQVITDTTEARLRADFSEHDTQAHFGCFDIARLHAAFAEGAPAHLRRRMLNRARLLAQDFTQRFILEYNDLVPAILARALAQGFRVEPTGRADNRPV